ncbi:MAG: hypothetical protein U9R50_04875 [Campylobacterota bacterium]|nr:hypothetical protein [Campylobacterota bacterium]
MTGNNKEAKTLIAASQELLSEADTTLQESDNQACENVAKYAQLRDEVLEQSVKRFDETYQDIENCSFIGSEVAYSDEKLEDIKEHFYNEAPAIAPIIIPNIRTAGFSSLIIGLIWSAITFAILLGVGMNLSGTLIYLDVMPTMEKLQPLFDFYGNVLTPGRGTAMNGMLFMGFLSVAVGFIFALLRYHGRSNKNLSAAQQTFEAAQAQKIEKDVQNSKIMTLCEYTQNLDKALHSLHVYLEEYNAVVNRIIHIEGSDFNEYCAPSQQKIETGVILYKTTQRVMNTDIITAEGALNPISRHELALAEERLEEIQYGELKYKEETFYVEPEEEVIEEEIVDNLEEQIVETLHETPEEEPKKEDQR